MPNSLSHTITLHPRAACLLATREILGANRIWHPTNPRQEDLVEVLSGLISDLGDFSETELAQIARWNHQEINNFLHEQGFSIELEPFGPDEFGVAATLKLALTWIFEGKETQIQIEGQAYIASELSEGVSFVTQDGRTVAKIATKTGDVAYITKATPADLLEASDSSLLTTAQRIQAAKEDPNAPYGGVKYPNLGYDGEEDISWIIGLWTHQANTDRRAEVVQAKQQTKFAMGRKGAKVESAAAMVVALEALFSTPPILVIDGPALVIVERPGLTAPVMVGVFGSDSWTPAQ